MAAAAIPGPRAPVAAEGERSGFHPGGVTAAGQELTMALLSAGIPLTLLLDLAEHFGPLSGEILETEGRLVHA